MRKYALVNGNEVRFAHLRETKSYLICDDKYGKFKKVCGGERIASSRKYSNWSWSGYDVYDADSQFVITIIQKNKENIFDWKVLDAAQKKIKSIKYHDDFIKLNEILNLGIEL